MNIFVLLLEWALRAFGVFWVLGGALTLQHARRANLIDTALEALTQEQEDRLVTQFLWIGGVLTLLSGAGLALATRWVLVPLVLLLLSQGLYFAIQERRFAQAKTAEDREDAEIAPTTRNAFSVSLVVAIAAFIAERIGVLR